MAITGDFKGTSRSKFQIERDGVVLKNVGGELEVRNAADTAYASISMATPTAGDNSNKGATTAFVQEAVSNVSGGPSGSVSLGLIIALG